MFQWPLELLVPTKKGVRLDRWHIPTEWTEWIIGGVLLIAVSADQIAHIVQARRRTRKVSPGPQGFPVQPVPVPVGTNS
jgi:hypothetical protein